ncbi:MAG: hypothetical protein RJA22_2969, partial [Verrucomicrobiota bacterium]
MKNMRIAPRNSGRTTLRGAWRRSSAWLGAVLIAWGFGASPGLRAGAAERLIISEFMAKSTRGITNDIDGAYSDWVEIYNADTSTVNLEGWSLTDSALLPGKWVFPATNLAPGQFLL